VVGAVLVWSVWVSATLASISFIHRYARNIPFFDDLTVVPVMTRHEPLTYQWASAQYNEHRNVIPRLVQVALLRAIPDFRAGLYLNAGLLSAAAAAAIVLARRLRGRTSIVDAVLPLSILTVGQWQCLLVGFALNLVMTGWITWRIIVVFGHSAHPPGWWACLRIGVFLVLLPLCGGSGMAMMPPLVLWLAGYVACGWWSGRDPGPLVRAIGLGLLMMTSATIAWYLCGYVKPAHNPPPPSMSAICSATLEFCSLVISPVGWGYRWVAGLAVVLLSSATVILLGIVAWGSPDQRPRALGLMAVLMSMLGIAFAVGYSRSGLGPGSGGHGRYITISMPLLGIMFFAWLLYGQSAARRVIHIGLLALICAGIPAQSQSAQESGRFHGGLFVRVENGLQRGMRPSRLLDLACPHLHPDRVKINECFQMLRQARVGKFRYMSDGGLADAIKPDSDTKLR
jgi:hypothetical protein